jgi:hypothetical protein
MQNHKEDKEELTPRDNIQNQHNEPDDATTGSSLPRLRGLNGDGRCFDEQKQRELQESDESKVEHVVGGLGVWGTKGVNSMSRGKEMGVLVVRWLLPCS